MAKRKNRGRGYDDAEERETRRKSGCLRRGCGCLFALILSPFLLAGGFLFWNSHRPQPGTRDKEIFPGIKYIREVSKESPKQVVHVITIPLDSPDVSFLVTPPDDKSAKRPLKARTTSQFLKEFKVQIAMNGDNFYPFYESTFMHYQPSLDDLANPAKLPDKLWSSYPQPGDPVETEGFSASRGATYCDGEEKRNAFPTLYLSEENKASFHKPVGKIYNAISGSMMILDSGKRLEPDEKKVVYTERHPRTAVGIDKSGKWLILLVGDGRQPNYSEGMTLMELSDALERHGAWSAMMLDGGGSSALAIEDRNGGVSLLNSPIEKRIPGRERPVANHIGVFVRSAKADSP